MISATLPGALDALERDAQLPFAGRLGQFLDRVPIAIAAAEVHAGRRRRAGSRWSTCSTRLTLSKNSLQSNDEMSRRLPIRFAIDACSAA